MPAITRTASGHTLLGNVEGATISDGAGNDYIDEGNGEDILIGSGQDIFVYNATVCTSDSNAPPMNVITDFIHREDNIDLCALLGGYDPDPMTNATGVDTNQLTWGFHMPKGFGV
jgi:Ca2+-binding RTX toxin-like protein